jgi:hypothetical protein
LFWQAALARARFGGPSSPASPRASGGAAVAASPRAAEAAAPALSPRSAAAVARGAARALFGAAAAALSPAAQQRRALWSAGLRVARQRCGRAFRAWARAARELRGADAKREADRTRAELEDCW